MPVLARKIRSRFGLRLVCVLAWSIAAAGLYEFGLELLRDLDLTWLWCGCGHG